MPTVWIPYISVGVPVFMIMGVDFITTLLTPLEDQLFQQFRHHIGPTLSTPFSLSRDRASRSEEAPLIPFPALAR